ncbi:hypothetical protein [Paracoccus sediminilitoris]|uniref:hypothetical protein n=1 Tax=Paracoccus sediminilitoris TaxID=2202419 RepID=UPI00272D55CA|nr:hypothetical protein [Paracoccus sediminilitoris]
MEREEAIQYNAMRNATFFLLSTIISELADAKGDQRNEYLQNMRNKALGSLDAARQQDPAMEKESTTADIAEVTRSIVAAAFDLAKSR